AVDLELFVPVPLEALDDEEVDLAHMADELVERGLRRAAMLMHQGPAITRGDHHLDGAGLAMLPAILARLAAIESLMGVLHGGDADAAPRQLRDELDDQRCLSTAAPTGETEDPHGLILARVWPSDDRAGLDGRRRCRRGARPVHMGETGAQIIIAGDD